MRIGEPPWKLGVSGQDIRHAVRYAVRRVIMDEDLAMLIGPSEEEALSEVGVLGIAGDDPVVIHAMHLRPKFYGFLGGR